MQSRYAAVLAGLAIWIAPVALAQQEKGDKEIGLSGSLLLDHSPVAGTGFVLGELGYFLSQRHYIGFNAAPVITVGNGSASVSGLFGGNYRYLIGSGTQKVWPFVGLGGGAFVSKAQGSSGTTVGGEASGEFGFKIYASQRTSFEIEYQLIYTKLKGAPSGFAQNSRSGVFLGFKHIF